MVWNGICVRFGVPLGDVLGPTECECDLAVIYG